MTLRVTDDRAIPYVQYIIHPASADLPGRRYHPASMSSAPCRTSSILWAFPVWAALGLAARRTDESRGHSHRGRSRVTEYAASRPRRPCMVEEGRHFRFPTAHGRVVRWRSLPPHSRQDVVCGYYRLARSRGLSALEVLAASHEFDRFLAAISGPQRHLPLVPAQPPRARKP